MNHPKSYTINDNISWTEEISGYTPGSDEMKLVLQNVSTGTKKELTATAVDGKYSFTLPGGVELSAGCWNTFLIGTKSAERTTLKRSQIIVYADPLINLTTTTTTTTLQAIEDLLAGRANNGAQSITIGDKSLTLMSMDELLKLHKYYAGKLASENQENIVNLGATNQSKIRNVGLEI